MATFVLSVRLAKSSQPATQLLVIGNASDPFGASLPQLSSPYMSQERPRRRRLSAQTARWELPLLWASAGSCMQTNSANTASNANRSTRENAASCPWERETPHFTLAPDMTTY